MNGFICLFKDMGKSQTLADDTTVEAIEKLSRLDLIIIDRIGFIRKKAMQVYYWN